MRPVTLTPVRHPKEEIYGNQKNPKKGIAFLGFHARIKVHSPNAALEKTIGGVFMAYQITDACVKCGSCAEQCPVEAISEGEDKYVIDPDVCVSCGSCAEQCPADAIEEG